MMGVMTVSSPTHFQPVFGASFSKAPKVLSWVLLPMYASLMKMGTQMKMAASSYTRMKAAPPFCPTM